MNRIWLLTLPVTLVALLPTTVSAAPVALVDNRVIIDNAPFFSVGPEDTLGTGNFALNQTTFIDIPYAIFNFGAISSVSNATLTWNFNSLFGGSPPASITLYAGNDASGTITTGDRFVGTAVNTFTYSGGELRSYNVTSFVSTALLSGQFFAVRLEATVPPGSLSGFYGGDFLVPSLDATVGSAGGIPEPGTLLLFAAGLIGVGLGGLSGPQVRSRAQHPSQPEPAGRL